METFDPYQQWLGIPSKLRPLNHYILLGISLFETDRDVILKAYDSRMQSLKLKEQGEFGQLTQELMAEVGRAKLELLDPDRKAIYDEQLKVSFSVPTADSDPASGLPAKFQSTEQSEKVVPQLSSYTPRPREQPIASGQSQQAGDELSVWELLTDVRIWVAIVSTTFVITLVTIKLLSSGVSADQAEAKNSATTIDASSGAIENGGTNDVTRKDESKASGSLADADPLVARLKKVQQGDGGEFDLPIRNATLDGALKSRAEGITDWVSGDQAAWLLVIDDRRTGFFNCKVTYRAIAEAPFDVQLGNRKPLPLTLYAHKEDFEEQFIVKIDKGNVQAFRLIAGTLEYSPRAVIKRITLTPTK